MKDPKVSIIVLNWNGLNDTVECLKSLQKVTYPNYEVVVVDNASDGNDVEVLGQQFAGYVDILKNDKNYGFAGGNNIGIRHAQARFNPDYVLLLNNDTVVAPDFLDEMVRAAESDPAAGILGPKIYWHDFDGRRDVIWTAGGNIRWWHPWIYDAIGGNDDDLPQYQRLATVGWISGAAMMIRRQVLEQVSLLNTDYFFGTEDVEYCLKARANGFKAVYVPTARVWHKVGRSRPKHWPSLAFLPDYHRLLRRNYSTPIYVYHLLITPVTITYRGVSRFRDVLAAVRRSGS